MGADQLPLRRKMGAQRFPVEEIPALVLMGVAVVFGRMDGVLWVGFKVMGYTYGSLLGLFLVAVWTTRRGSDLGGRCLAGGRLGQLGLVE